MKTLNATEMAKVSDEQVERWDAEEAMRRHRVQAKLLGIPHKSPDVIKTASVLTFTAPLSRPATWTDVVNEVARITEIKPELITSPVSPGSRVPSIVRARYLAAWALRLRKQSYGQIGQWLGGRDHSTVIFGIKKLKRTATPEERALVRRLAGKS